MEVAVKKRSAPESFHELFLEEIEVIPAGAEELGLVDGSRPVAVTFNEATDIPLLTRLGA